MRKGGNGRFIVLSFFFLFFLIQVHSEFGILEVKLTEISGISICIASGLVR